MYVSYVDVLLYNMYLYNELFINVSYISNKSMYRVGTANKARCEPHKIYQVCTIVDKRDKYRRQEKVFNIKHE